MISVKLILVGMIFFRRTKLKAAVEPLQLKIIQIKKRNADDNEQILILQACVSQLNLT